MILQKRKFGSYKIVTLGIRKREEITSLYLSDEAGWVKEVKLVRLVMRYFLDGRLVRYGGGMVLGIGSECLDLQLTPLGCPRFHSVELGE